jgi:hypothetical protein
MRSRARGFIVLHDDKIQQATSSSRQHSTESTTKNDQPCNYRWEQVWYFYQSVLVQFPNQVPVHAKHRSDRTRTYLIGHTQLHKRA